MEPEEGEDQQPGVVKKPKLLPPTADEVEKHDGEEGGESSPAKKGRLASDSLMVGGL